MNITLMHKHKDIITWALLSIPTNSFLSSPRPSPLCLYFNRGKTNANIKGTKYILNTVKEINMYIVIVK